MKRKTASRTARPKQAMNPLVTLRAQTIPSAKKVASKRACRGRVQVND
jgi:hypothetical protein